jgi:hypothetical protein
MIATSVGAALGLGATLGQALDRGPPLKDNEAIVLVRMLCGSVRVVEFWQFGKREGFTLTACTSLHPLTVKAGHRESMERQVQMPA